MTTKITSKALREFVRNMLTEQEEENLELVPASEPDEEGELEVYKPINYSHDRSVTLH